MCPCTNMGGGHIAIRMKGGPLPASASNEQRLQRFVDTVTYNMHIPFDAKRFVEDMQGKGMTQRLAETQPQVERLMGLYKRHQDIRSVAAKLKCTQKALRKTCDEAVERFFSYDWARTSPLHCILISNAFQVSDSDEFPMDDPGLRMVFDIQACLRDALEMGSSRLDFVLELPEDPLEG